MSSKSPPTDKTRTERADARGQADVVLRDESDEIIDHLKEQLRALQAQLDGYKARGAGGGAGGGSSRPGREERNALDLGLTPHIASRLRIPAEELSTRLERLIGQVDDPALRAELEQCRDSAFFLSDTFQRIAEQHQALTESLTADALVMDADAFCERLEGALRQRDLGMRVAPASALPAQLRLSPQSAITVLMTLAELARDLFGRSEHLTVACPGLAEVAEGADTFLELEIDGDRPWGDVTEGEAVSTVAIRSGARSRAVVDLLYVEKIIEMRGGSLDFLRRDGRVCGFTVHIPITLLQKAPPRGPGTRA